MYKDEKYRKLQYQTISDINIIDVNCKGNIYEKYFCAFAHSDLFFFL